MRPVVYQSDNIDSYTSATEVVHTAPLIHRRDGVTFAVIADIHGNVPALDAVLADLEHVQPDAVVVAGDFVNRGPQSRAALERIAPYGFPAISGNHDTWLAALAQGVSLPDGWETPWWTPVRMASAELTPEWQAWLSALPFSMRLELPGASPVRIVHGSPRHSREGMGRMLGDAILAEALAETDEPMVIGAHIHYPYERRLRVPSRATPGEHVETHVETHVEKHVVVIGAVGCPFNGDINAQYGLFTWDGADWRFEHRSVPYDHEPVYTAWRDCGYLADGSLASELMMLEHQTAITQYVPFWEWALEHDLPLTHESHALFVRQRAPYVAPPQRAQM
ncbi:MAG TPA: metallophosphoesterase family protein [Ktedonobacterales bacterium]|nr:metallophosphoesterase family protein [Ktedonobacterales bacterium]